MPVRRRVSSLPDTRGSQGEPCGPCFAEKVCELAIRALAWTLADLAGRVAPKADDVAEALFFRTGRSESWVA
jgi:hypothetical protein